MQLIQVDHGIPEVRGRKLSSRNLKQNLKFLLDVPLKQLCCLNELDVSPENIV